MTRLLSFFRPVLLILLLVAPSMARAAIDHQYSGWHALLQKHVAWTEQGGASTVDYQGFLNDRASLREVLGRFTAVTQPQYDQFSRDQKLAFLINAYNAFTIDLILSKYPDLKSIKDLGSFFSSPWKKSFFSLLGQERTLDWIEHETIRAPGVFDEPRIHFVVNCASIGCPALRPAAMRAGELEKQLADSTRRFLSDRSRNRFDPAGKVLQVSKIFDWYGADFAKGHQGIGSLKQFFASHANLLADGQENQTLVREQRADIDFLDYDWSLNRR